MTDAEKVERLKRVLKEWNAQRGAAIFKWNNADTVWDELDEIEQVLYG